jgi:hypothetical protein
MKRSVQMRCAQWGGGRVVGAEWFARSWDPGVVGVIIECADEIDGTKIKI